MSLVTESEFTKVSNDDFNEKAVEQSLFCLIDQAKKMSYLSAVVEPVVQ